MRTKKRYPLFNEQISLKRLANTQKAALSKTILFIIGSLLLHLPIRAQEGKLFSADRELSNSMINHLLQDSCGVIWISTEDGLNSYDGSKFKVYKNDEKTSNSLMNNYVRCTLEDNTGRFFIGTLTGLQMYDRQTDQFTELPLHFETGERLNANIACLLQRKNGEILAGTNGHGIFRLKSKNGTLIMQQDMQFSPSYLINELYEDRKGRMWLIAGDQGVYCKEADNSSPIRQLLPQTNEGGYAGICEDNFGRIYVGSNREGIMRYDEIQQKFLPIESGERSNYTIKTLYTLSASEILIGTDGAGVKVFNLLTEKVDDGTYKVPGLNFRKIKAHTILKDRQNNIWFGCFQKGVILIPSNNNAFGYIGSKSVTRNSIGSCCIMSICRDDENTLWVGTDNDGIYATNAIGIPIRHFAHDPNSHHSVPATIMSIFQDSQKQMWIGSYLDGLWKLDRKTGKCQPFVLPDNDSSISVYDISEDDSGNLWIATMGSGIYRIKLSNGDVWKMPSPKSGREYRDDQNLLHNRWVNCLLITRNEKIYFGTFDGFGCMDLKTNSLTSTYGVNRLLPGEVVYALHEDRNGNIWIGTGKGLQHFNVTTHELTTYTTDNGLPNNTISAIVEDASGHLWISTGYGISRFNPTTRIFDNYYAADGLQSNEFSKGAVWVGGDGNQTIYLGGTNGVTFFDPNQIVNFVRKPDIRIADFYINDRAVRKGMLSGNQEIIDSDVSQAKRFNLSYRDNSFSIEFTAMEFYNPERISYSYNVNNIGWYNMQAGTNRVSFSNIAPGKHHFQIRSKNYNTFSDIYTFDVIITPPWYATWWMRIIYILTVTLIITFIILQIQHRYRTQQEMIEHIHAEEINEAKLQFFINISHEIRTPMSLILSPLQKLMATDDNKEHQKNYGIIHRNAERILRLINQLMDIRKIEKGRMQLQFRETDIVAFLQEIYQTFEYPAVAKNINLIYDHEPEELMAYVDPKNFDKIIFNLMSNALKFTPENGTIRITLRTGDKINPPTEALRHYFEIVVEDSGIGIIEEDKDRIFDRFYQSHNSQSQVAGTGVGLHLTHSLVQLHQGTIEVFNNENAPGCRFIVRLPLGKNHLTTEEIENEHETVIPVPHTDAASLPQMDIEEEKEKELPKYRDRILIVDDEEEIRRYLEEELGNDFYTKSYSNGKEALDAIFKQTPDLVISDVMMPEMDGLTFCQKVKSNININHIPIILLTAKNREEDNLEGLEIGADAYITKPFNIEILRKTVVNLIKNRKSLKNTYTDNQTQKNRVKKVTAETPDEKLLNRVMKVINKNIGNANFTVDMLADSAGISRVHLHRKMKELTNQTTRDFIRNVRLKQAATLLAEKKYTINEVAVLTGLPNVSYFSTAFKALYGVSPTTYMELHVKPAPNELVNAPIHITQEDETATESEAENNV